MARCSEAIRSHVDGWISCELQLCCCTATKKGRVRACDLIPTYHTEGSIVVLPAANLRGPPDKYGLLTSEGHPISMVCSRSGVRLYAATPRSGPGLLCAAARFVSAKKATIAAAGCRASFYFIFLECCGMNSFFFVTQSFSPHRRMVTFLKIFFLCWKG